jgi:hypothetical protein
MEILYAWERGKKILLISGNNEISPWLIYHSHKRFRSLEDAINYISG